LLCGSAAAELGPHMLNLTDLAELAPEVLMAEIKASPLCAVVREVAMPADISGPAATLPTVTAHGMGDSCFEPGFSSITRAIGKKTGTYARCIPIGGNIITDTIDGLLKNMDASVDVFAAKIKADPKLSGGFNAIGFSQGNSLIRGYIEKYNDPPVNSFISVHGTVQGVAAFPSCFRQGKPVGLICKAVAEVLGDLAYSPISQNVLFQADYFRAASQVDSKAYLAHSQIARWNNEDPSTASAIYKSNFAKTKKFAMVKALKDSMVYPNEGEHWGALEEGRGYKAKPLAMQDTKFYKQDLFGLKTADEAGKIFFETTPGDHLEFSDDELFGWVQKYFIDVAPQAETVVV